MRAWLPLRGLGLMPANRMQRWTPRLLVMCAVLMVWSGSEAIKDRFEDARSAVVGMYKSRRRPGASYEGFIAALAARSERLLHLVCEHLRQQVQKMAGDGWEVLGWVLFGVDGSRFDLPMTEANEHVHGCAGKEKTWPQMFVTMLFHVGTGLPWAFVRGPAASSERAQLLRMLKLLPAAAMLIADAGYTGYELLKAVMDNRRCFLIRVGSNVSLLRRLGYAVKEDRGTVYLWPQKHQKKDAEPLVLRLITLVDGRNRRVHLLTNVLEEARLSDADAIELYRRRWQVELIYRAIKQTLRRRKLLSDSPRNAEVELDWTVVGYWMLGLMSVQKILADGGQPVKWSVAASLRVVRRSIKQGQTPRRGPALGQQLSECVKDSYVRRRSKKARHWPAKKKEKPPGDPRARNATEAEVQAAQRLREATVTHRLAA
jgi:hypothetical protein